MYWWQAYRQSRGWSYNQAPLVVNADSKSRRALMMRNTMGDGRVHSLSPGRRRRRCWNVWLGCTHKRVAVKNVSCWTSLFFSLSSCDKTTAAINWLLTRLKFTIRPSYYYYYVYREKVRRRRRCSLLSRSPGFWKEKHRQPEKRNLRQVFKHERSRTNGHVWPSRLILLWGSRDWPALFDNPRKRLSYR